MNDDRKTTGAISSDLIVDAIRQEIIDGKLPPGAQLPTYDELQRRFRTTRMTVHRACERLISIGYVQSRPKIGTYVSDAPPHLCRYGLAFPSRPDGVSYWTDFWTILRSSAKSVVKADPPKQIITYYGIAGHSDVEDYQRLMADVRMRRLAGLILLSGPHLLLNTPLLDEDCPVPRVYVGANMWRWRIPSVSPELHSFLHRGLEHAASRSRRRPMMICTSMPTESTWNVWSEACIAHGATPERWQILSVPLTPWEGAAHLTQVLMQLPADRRPDALVVADDHLVESVTAGLLLSKMPESELPVVIAHANYPKTPRALLPVTFLGFDSAAIIRACIDVLDAQRRGEEPSQETTIPASFITELPSSSYANDAAVLAGNHFVGEHHNALADPDPFPPNL